MSRTWQNFNSEKEFGKGGDQQKMACEIQNNNKKALKIEQNGQKQKRGEGTFKEGDGGIREKLRFMLLERRFVCYEAFMEVSSRKEESYY